MQEEELRRKIPVDHLSNRGGYARNFGVHFHEDAVKTHRKEFAALRKEFKAYKQNHHVETHNGTIGTCWTLHPDMLVIFADWMEFQEPLDVLMERAKQEGKERYEREEREREERRVQWHQEMRNKRIPCSNSCKVRISNFECVGGEGPFDGLLSNTGRKPILHRFSLQFEGTTKEEIEAWRYFVNVLEEEKINRTIVTWMTNGVVGNGQNWILHEYVLLAYSDWLALDDDIDALIARAVEKRKQEELRWEEIRDRTWHQRSVSPWVETGLSKAFTLFNLDSSATLDDVKKRYRVLAKLYHPDSGGHEEEFKRLNQANQILMQHIG